MKKILPFVILAVAFAACNNSDMATNNHDASGHAAHNDSGSKAKSNAPMAALHEAMNRMMTGMKTVKPTGDPDYDFATLMKLHHQSAVEMAKVLVANGTDSVAKAHAAKTVTEQEGEIAAFDRFLQSAKPSGNSDYGQRAMQMMSAMEHGKMEMGSLEAIYASMMIPHHQDGVKMAEEYLKVGRAEELKKIAQSIIQTQPKEIEDYRQWLKASE
ncbi:MAG TPA: DUF305 domain-containing protein [Flavisolibacter sp.]|nr:DUF305 domain-containing protein [Flavisolibacter sp.]